MGDAAHLTGMTAPAAFTRRPTVRAFKAAFDIVTCADIDDPIDGPGSRNDAANRYGNGRDTKPVYQAATYEVLLAYGLTTMLAVVFVGGILYNLFT